MYYIYMNIIEHKNVNNSEKGNLKSRLQCALRLYNHSENIFFAVIYVFVFNDIRIYIYIYNPLYINWPLTNADMPHVIILYILYFICQKLYWTVSGQLSNIGNIGQFQNEATGALRTRYRRTKAVSMYLIKIISIFLHLRKILICFRIEWFYSE